jgi:hypothetical protein
VAPSTLPILGIPVQQGTRTNMFGSREKCLENHHRSGLS